MMKPDNAHIDLKGVALLIIICASWGLNQVAIKVGIDGVPPVLQAGIRSTGSAFLVLLWMVLRGRPVLKRDGTIWWGILVGILFSVEFILIYWGLEFTNASRSVIFLNTSPFVVALGAQLFVKTENLTRVQILGLIIAFGGIIVAFNESLNLPTREMLVGDCMLLGAAVFWGSVTVVIKASPTPTFPPTRPCFTNWGSRHPFCSWLPWPWAKEVSGN